MGSEKGKVKNIQIDTPAEEASAEVASAKTTAVAKVKNRVPMKYPKKNHKKPLPKVVIKDAEIVEPKSAATISVKKHSKSQKTQELKNEYREQIKKLNRKDHGEPRAQEDTSSKQSKQNTNSKSTEQQTPKKESKKMKLPRVRRIHIKIRYIIASIIVLALAGFFGRVAIWENGYIKAMEGTERQAAVTADQNEEVYDGGSEVDSSKPTEVEVAEYEVAADKPRYFSIATLNIRNARVVEIGRTASGSLDSPYNIYNVGWYTGSALPGQSGVVVMDAHGGDLGNGIFKNLPNIGIGDEIKIEMGDKKTVYTYVVKEVTTKPIGEEANSYMSTVFQPLRPGVPTLSLITCTGDWLQKSQTYSHRFFVRAELVG